jgi:2-succinyl-5-enolpyruvyl-6-hydroxy-3-cyclohexene-1-carboxylate synthase
MARAVVDEMVRNGVRHACLSPGSRSAPLALALAENDGIELHVSLDERSCSFLAIGIAKASLSGPVAILCTSGTAAANFLPAIVEAHHSRTPLLVFTADRPPELRDTGASQTIDQIKMYGDSVRWFVEVGAPEELPTSNSYWRSIVSRACAVAQGSPPGPVHLNVAFREPLVPPADSSEFGYDLDGRPDGEPWTRFGPGTSSPTGEEVEALAAELARADSGVIVVGAGRIQGPSGEAPQDSVGRLAASLGWPLLADPFGWEWSGSLRAGDALSTYDHLLRINSFRVAHRPDVVVRIGAGLLSKPLASFVANAPTQILFDRGAAFLDPGRSLTRLVEADPLTLCHDLTTELERSGHAPTRERRAAWRDADALARRTIDEVLDERDDPSEPRTARDVLAALPDGSTLVVASSMPLRDVEAFMAPRRAVRLLANRGANGIDGFVSTALGAALASTGPTVALTGDLSMLHDQNGLLLLRSEGVNVTFVVINNDGGGIFSFLPQAALPEHFEKLFGTPQSIDFEGFASFHRCHYDLLDAASDLPALMTASFDRGGATIIEVRTERGANVDLHERIHRSVADSLGTDSR